jgi:hypothetical protein
VTFLYASLLVRALTERMTPVTRVSPHTEGVVHLQVRWSDNLADWAESAWENRHATRAIDELVAAAKRKRLREFVDMGALPPPKKVDFAVSTDPESGFSARVLKYDEGRLLKYYQADVMGRP